MRVKRALRDAPSHRAWTAPLRWLLRLPSRVSLGVSAWLEAFRFDQVNDNDPELADLWLTLLAADPDGTWHAWPGAVRRTQLDDHDQT
jgi:hypothetical protein